MMTDIPDNLDQVLLFSHRIMFDPDAEKPHQVYNHGELDVINGFKEQYMSATSSGLRKQIAQVQMFPALFNYWKKNGKVFVNENLRIKSFVGSLLLVLHKFKFDIYLIRNSQLGYETHGELERVRRSRN
jgi:hypothetical protein